MPKLLEKHNIYLPKGTRKDGSRFNIEHHDERFHALKDGFSKSHAFLIDSRASNHMVASKESFSSLQLTYGPSIQMGDENQIQAEGKGSIKLEHGLIKNFLDVPSLAANLLSVYKMTHTCSPKRVVFGPESMDISDISTENIIVKGVANHASKAYEFSHFLPFSDPVHSYLPLERGGKRIISTPFAISTSISYSEA